MKTENLPEAPHKEMIPVKEANDFIERDEFGFGVYPHPDPLNLEYTKKKSKAPSPKAYILQKDTIGQFGNVSWVISAGTKFEFIVDRYKDKGGWYYGKDFVESNPAWFIELSNKEDALAAIQSGKITPLQYILMEKHL